MNNLLLNLSNKTQLLNGIRLRRVERSRRRRTTMLFTYLPFVSGFQGYFSFSFFFLALWSPSCFYLFYCLDCFVVLLEIAARLPQIDNEALTPPFRDKDSWFSKYISCWFSLRGEWNWACLLAAYAPHSRHLIRYSDWLRCWPHFHWPVAHPGAKIHLPGLSATEVMTSWGPS